MADANTNYLDVQLATKEAPLDISPEEVQAALDAIVIPPLYGESCVIKREKKVDENEAKKGSTLARQLRAINESILRETDCVALQQKIKSHLNSLKETIVGSDEEIRKKLEEITPILNIPLNPFKIPKWVAKFVLGRILPDYDATIDLIKRVTEVLVALNELIQTVDQVVPKLEACAIALEAEIKQNIENEIDELLEEAKKAIEKAIADAICRAATEAGITTTDVDDILTGVSAIKGLTNSFDALKDTVDLSLQKHLDKLSQNESYIQNVTGIPPVLDTSSLDAFTVSIESPEYAAYRAQVQSVLTLPEPVNSVLPVITGTAAVGETLTCSNGTWTANGVTNTFALAFQWMKQGQEIFNANTYQYTPSLDDVDYPLYCRVTAQNQINIEEAYTSNTAPVVFSMSSGNKPAITGTPASGQTLTCSEGTWPFTPTSVTYEWIRVVSPGSNVRVQSSSSNNQYFVKTADIGNTIKCKVVAQAFRYTLAIDTASTAVIT